MTQVEARQARALAQQIGEQLAGKPPEVIGAALADLLATLLAGHYADSPAETVQLREVLLQAHIETVRQLIPVNEALFMQRLEPEGRA